MTVVIKNLLAKARVMYYPKPYKLTRSTWLRFAAHLLILSLIIFSHPFQAVAKEEDLLSPSAHEYRDLGYAEQQKGNYQAALAYYGKAISLGIRNAVLYNDMGVIYEQMGYPPRAEWFYLESIKMDEDYLPPYTNLAYFYKERNDTEKAIEYFRKRLMRCTKDDPWYDRINKELKSMLTPDFKDVIVLEDLEITSREMAAKTRRQAMEELYLETARADFHYRRGQEFMQNQQYEEAAAEFEQALSITPHNPKVSQDLSRVRYEQRAGMINARTYDALEKFNSGDLESAKKEFQDILATIPDEPNPVSK